MNRYSLTFPLAHGLKRIRAVFRQEPEDFRVEEILGFELTGQGEHLWLYVEKKGLNTVDVAGSLAKAAGVRSRDIGYAGLKDKQAIARQWFSIPCDSELPDLVLDGCRILSRVRNSRKLRRGSHRGNRFRITLREAEDSGNVQDHLALIGKQGVPNYFGPQRFGIDGKNLDMARALFDGKAGRMSRHKRGLYLSAARAWLFNEALSYRVNDASWDHCLAGDIMVLEGTNSLFAAAQGDEAIPGRLDGGDIHPTGPLWGRGALPTSDEVKRLEEQVAANCPEFVQGLEAAGLKQERRALRVIPEEPGLGTDGEGNLVVEFSLPRGAYATSVLREMVEATGL